MSKKDLKFTINTEERSHGHDPGAFPIALK